MTVHWRRCLCEWTLKFMSTHISIFSLLGEKITNDEVRSQVGSTRSIIQLIMERKLSLFGHICRMDDQRLWRTWCSEWWTERHTEEGLAEYGWVMLKIGVTWIYTLSAGWLRIDYYGNMLWRVLWTPTGVEPMDGWWWWWPSPRHS